MKQLLVTQKPMVSHKLSLVLVRMVCPFMNRMHADLKIRMRWKQ